MRTSREAEGRPFRRRWPPATSEGQAGEDRARGPRTVLCHQLMQTQQSGRYIEPLSLRLPRDRLTPGKSQFSENCGHI